MGFLEANAKNIGLLVLAAATIALSITLGVTLAKHGDTQPNRSSSIPDTNDTASDGSSPDVSRGVTFDDLFDGGDPNRAAVTIDIDLSSTTLTCPGEEGSSQPFKATDLSNPGAVELGLSSANTLCTLVRIHNPSDDGARENTFVQPIGRSYSGYPWETTRGKYVQETSFDCASGSSCIIDLNAIEAKGGGGTYQLTTFFEPAQYTKKDVVARFLEQATFGQTRATIDALEAAEPGSMQDLKRSMAFANWIADQQDVARHPVMSHRAQFRKHLNARFELSNNMGRNSLPCDVGSRYRRFTFTEKDAGKKLALSTSGTARLLSVDGVARTMLNGAMGYLDKEAITEILFPDGEYNICSVNFDKWQGDSEVKVKHPSHNKCIELVVKGSDGVYYSNPPIQVQAGQNDVMLNIPVESAQLIDMAYAALQTESAPNSPNNPENPEIILTAALGDAICAQLSTNGGAGDKAVIAEWNGQHYIFDPRHHVLANDLSAPLADGGGAIAKGFGSLLGDEFGPRCSNTPRSFVNEYSCFLSNDPDVCSYRPTSPKTSRAVAADLLSGDSKFTPTLEKLKAVYQETGAGAEGTFYLYAIDGLSVEKDATVVPPCQRIDNSRSRWVVQSCSATASEGLGSKTVAFFEKFLARSQKKNENPNFLDWWVPKKKIGSCDAADENKKGFEIKNTNEPGTCFKNVHPDHLSVYDFTDWVESHPGNSDARNPIAEFAEEGSGTLMFPDWHEMDRWQQQKQRLRPQALRLGVPFDFYRLPQTMRTEEIALGLGVGLSNQAAAAPDEPTGPFMVCGSPGEVANIPSLGGNVKRGAFDGVTDEGKTTKRGWFAAQKGMTWLITAMSDDGQLRQRAAWALSQIFAISSLAVKGGKDTTEAFVNYYDIFVRNAFGNYRDVMKEVSFSPMMAEMLTYYGGRSTAVVMEDEGNLEYADENYAREIMQLFTVGLYRLNPDGTQALNGEGDTAKTYTNNDIEEYARSWTGFIRSPRRGNFEQLNRRNQVDPMQIFAPWRDRLPKMGLDGKYVGDGLPLCSDLPPQHFLSKGSVYQLLDSFDPEMHTDPIEWRAGTDAVQLMLDPSSKLGQKLSGATKIVLDESVVCTGTECSINAIRTVKAGDNYYEYLRAPCANEAFYNNAKTIARRQKGDRAMCGNPLVGAATAACCGDNQAWSEQYDGERMLFATASERCNPSMCNVASRPACTGSKCLADNYYWTSDACAMKVKVDLNSGKVGIVHGPSGVSDVDIATVVNPNTKTFFRVNWQGDYPTELATCDSLGACTLTSDDMCLCDVTVTTELVFSGTTPPSRQDILASLSAGAFDTEPTAVLTGDDVKVYGAGSDGSLAIDSSFAVLDGAGQRVLRKNSKSTVSITGTGLSFRNPVHVVSLNDPEPRDAHQETDAVLDHYFYHPNTAPFLAYRFAHRFGISNPSGRYTETIANAFKTGTYSYETGGTSKTFGSGQYGDLAATFAAVLLDREARDFALDADPSHGSLKEPLIKIVGMTRALNFELNDIFKWIEFAFDFGETIGQMAHEIPSVFSFFLPEYQASGPVSQGELVAPEAQVLTGPRIIDSMNGILSMLKYGLNSCLDGFGVSTDGFGGRFCGQARFGTKLGIGGTSYTPSSDNVAVDELATLMTAGRLSPETRAVVQQGFSAKSDEYGSIRAQMLISGTPEFHSTGITQPSGENRAKAPASTFTDKPYKAVVYLFLSGGYDSFNTLVPNTCSATNDAGKNLVEQYLFERTAIALTEEERNARVIDATGQPCEQFGIHPQLGSLERLYNEGDLAFFANFGQLDAAVTKDDYFSKTRTQLFAHNIMQEEARRMDPWDASPGSGILGRMADVLEMKGFSPQPITIQDTTVATVGVAGAGPDPLVVALKGPAEFARTKGKFEFDMKDFVANLNNATQLHSSVFGETWSVNLQRAIEDSNVLTSALDNVNLVTDFPDDEDGQQYMRTAKSLASLILTHQERGADRDLLYAQLGGWDMHASVKEGLDTEFAGLDKHISAFEAEMKAQGLWDQVTVIVASDFGRTLTANSGQGCDHAWGGNYFMFGGDVKGGQILGEYPPDISEAGPLNVGRGRIIPTSSWESMFQAPLQWMGLDTDADLDYCMPNRGNTGATNLNMDQVFKSGRRSLRRNQ